jgi:hypothetical protein
MLQEVCLFAEKSVAKIWMNVRKTVEKRGGQLTKYERQLSFGSFAGVSTRDFVESK